MALVLAEARLTNDDQPVLEFIKNNCVATHFSVSSKMLEFDFPAF